MTRPWLKIRKTLLNHHVVLSCSSSTSAHSTHIVGGLVAIWSVADDNCGDLPGWSLGDVDELTGIAGLGRSLRDAGWLSESNEGLTVPEFTAWMGGSRDNGRAVACSKQPSNECAVTPQTTPGENAVSRQKPKRDQDKGAELLHGLVAECPASLPSYSPLSLSRSLPGSKSLSNSSSEEGKKGRVQKREMVNRIKSIKQPGVDAELVAWLGRNGMQRAFEQIFDGPKKLRLAQDSKKKDLSNAMGKAARRGITLTQIRLLLKRLERERESIRRPYAWLLHILIQDLIEPTEVMNNAT